MATFTTKEIVDKIIARNGDCDPEDGPNFDIVRIVQYTTPEGDPNNWGIVFRCEISRGMLFRYEYAENCLNPQVIFTRKEPGNAGH